MQWANIPTHLLRAELLRRQEHEHPECGTKGNRGYYNTPLHVFALALILTVSTAGTPRLTFEVRFAAILTFQRVPFPSSPGAFLGSQYRTNSSSSRDISAPASWLRLHSCTSCPRHSSP